ncbi:hypothetical protein ID850_04165 [Xenorhabdus sp. Flor]|uniref:hypothetical protein n=1 Tax=Xenorhabdus cabanillasii TaxID=351673 RepID=UPI0019A2C515|nr:hypothetical protein [Xenorhabdus sp. Flor]MBD2813974.1 hypothetical protein [Xenorhabdus sp. Flor]
MPNLKRQTVNTLGKPVYSLKTGIVKTIKKLFTTIASNSIINHSTLFTQWGSFPHWEDFSLFYWRNLMNNTSTNNVVSKLSFLHTPYEVGVSLRSDVFQSQITVLVTGDAEYPEDDPVYGTYCSEKTLIVCKTSTLTDAVQQLKVIIDEDSWIFRDKDVDYYDPDFGRDMGPVSFNPRMVTIYDRYNRRILGGQIASKITWARPVTRKDELVALEKERQRLNSEGSYEHGWDNYSTAKYLWKKASLLLLHVIDSTYLIREEMDNIFLQDTSVSWNEW